MESSKDKQIDWQWFGSLSEAEQFEEMKTWDYDTWDEYEKRGGIITMDEFGHYEYGFLHKLIKEKKEARSNGHVFKYPFDMARLSHKLTGLPVLVTVLSGEVVPKMGFQNDTSTRYNLSKTLYLSISDNPQLLSENAELQISTEQFEQVRQWVVLNQSTLLAYWRCEIFTDKLIEQLKTL